MSENHNHTQKICYNILYNFFWRKFMSQVFYYDLYGEREDKYTFLLENDITTVNWQKLKPTEPNNYFVPKDFSNAEEYEKGFKIDELMEVMTTGIVTSNDGVVVSNESFSTENSFPYFYRPLDIKYIDYDLKKIERPRYEVMKNMILCDNYGIATMRQITSTEWTHITIASSLVDNRQLFSAEGTTKFFPLYLYQDSPEKSLDFSNPCGNISNNPRSPNLNQQIINQIAEALQIKFVADHESQEIDNLDEQTYFTPLTVLDYIYAVLHKPSYRSTYKEFLKIDFPRIPYPTSKEELFYLAKKGESLRKLHLMKSSELSNIVTKYPIAGENLVEKIEYKNGNVYINKDQYFEAVPEVAWNFYIGGYQPLQKYLKDRKGKNLSAQEIMHYQRIVVALLETAKIMEELN